MAIDEHTMDQTARYVEAESQKPQNQQNDKDCPKHCVPPLGQGAKFSGVAMSQDRSVLQSLRLGQSAGSAVPVAQRGGGA